jgi:hypothetical protein
VWKHLVKELKSVQTMLADKSLRRLFVATCVPDPAVAARFKNYSSVEIDWRWETLCDALDHLIPLIDLLRSRFNLSRMMVSDDGKCEAKLLKDVDRILVQQHRLLELAELVRLSGKRLEQTAHRLEGCECHAHVWMARGSHKRKQRNVKASTGTDTCYMKTRQSTWFIVDGLRQLCADLQQCTSTLLQERLSKLPPVERAQLVRLQAELSDSLVEELTDKYAFLQELPYKCLGIFIGDVDPDRVALARQIASECLSKYDELVAVGKENLLHRVAHRLLAPSTECRRQLELFACSDFPLKAFPIAWVCIKQYAMIPVVGRRVEAAHAQIKKV